MFETKNLNILIIEDHNLAIDALRHNLRGIGKLTVATNSNSARSIIATQTFDLAFVDLNLHGKMDGFEIAKELKEQGVYVIIASGFGEKIHLKKGFELSKANDYIMKPLSSDKTKLAMERYLRHKNSKVIRSQIQAALHTQSPSMDSCIQHIQSIYGGTTPIYLFGPTGVGKQVVAELIHELSNLPKDKFFQINCASIPETIIESLLFGHERGAFTGADSKRIGYLEMANGGTLFLDEVATMSRAMQDKIITAIEQKKFRRVSSNIEIESNFRLIAATSSDIAEEIRLGNFRSDLFFRLNGTHITIPSLKARIDDLEILIQCIKENHSSDRILYISDTVMDQLKKYHWPGNIRELKNIILHWLESDKSFVDIHNLPKEFFSSPESTSDFVSNTQIDLIKEIGMRSFITKIRDEVILRVYKANGGHLRKTASQLQVNTSQIYKALGIKEKVHEPDYIA
jgi:DNA-binding NtrC family response regulator